MSNDKKTVWAIQHVGYEDLGSFETVLKNRGFDVKYFCFRNIDHRALFAHDPDLLVVLGGPMGAYEIDKHPWIINELKFIGERIECDKPLLGICLGAQMIAMALGANTYPGHQGKEIGWSKITVNDEGMKTPLRYLDGEHTPMMHWHGDTFDLPDGAVLLASSDKYKKQAFSYNDHVFAMQCHAEVTANKLRLWYASNLKEIAEVGKTVEELKKEAEAYNQILSVQASLFLNEWLDSQGL